jgi:site-specific DNA-methyltransferase (adenine-specific)
MGSGTTAIACLKEDRNFIGSEISKEFYDLANKRIECETSQMKLF